VRHVTRLPLEPEGILLKIERTNGGIDYLLFGADAAHRTGSDGGLRFEFDGQMALITFEGGARTLKMIGGAHLTCGNDSLVTSVSPPAKLLKVDGQELTVEGNVPVKPGAAVIVRHRDSTTTSFNVAAVRRRDGDMILKTGEAATLTGSPEGPLTLRPFPKTTHPGPHEVQFVTRAARRIEAKG
jgi:hypothetical protein